MPTRRDPTARFSDRVDDYVRSRPGYPDSLLGALHEDAGLSADAVVADVGAGSGISSAFLLRSGCTVLAVEPNAAMRRAAEDALGATPRFHSVAGTAEATGLPDASVSLIVAAQAFHWFEPTRCRAEWLRILQPGGCAALIWNARRTDRTPFLRAYEALIQQYGTDDREVNRANVPAARLEALFGAGYERRTFYNQQVLDLDGLTSRLLSSSYTPAEGDPARGPMLDALADLFAAHEEAGTVRIEYDTELNVGRLEA